ncbi:scytalone dehydratase [Aspergillus ustus]|uniref:Scytalone dehydratase n=1 Tax=Aspergillus ustus TaxID=40382 RepID=A0A0C1E585_ASPUT|nr:scytalone dehydratase [Aspergillus ustus]
MAETEIGTIAAYKPPSYEAVAGCQHVLFEWAESYDSKDWARLAKCIAPTLHVNYTTVMSPDSYWPYMPAPDFIALVSSPRFLGNPRIKTQHLIGASKFTQTEYADDDLAEVIGKEHAHGKATMQFKRVDGVWKFAGLEPDIRWAEHELEEIFKEEELK